MHSFFMPRSPEKDKSLVNPPVRNSMSDIFVENYAANELTAKGIALFCWKGNNPKVQIIFFIRIF